MKNNFINQIIFWIDEHLDRDIGVQDIVKRSGYSNAQLHRIFKKNLGCSLNEYLINKRLYKCACALKFTSLTISELATRYHYANSQAFSRVFKNFYGVTPTEYRQDPFMAFQQIFNWRHEGELKLSGCVIEYVYLDNLALTGISGSYRLPTESVGKPHILFRAPIENQFQIATQRPVERVYTLCKPVHNDLSIVDFEFQVGMESANAPCNSQYVELAEAAGDYLKFTFPHATLRSSDYNAMAYWGCISVNRIKRRNGYDIECFDYTNYPSEYGVNYTLYIPVIFDDNLTQLLLNLRGGKQ